jgi:hypothetical protein
MRGLALVPGVNPSGTAVGIGDGEAASDALDGLVAGVPVAAVDG